MDHLVGDVQGCDDALARLMDVIGFSPSRDRLLLLGDLVNRGPASHRVLKRLVALGDAAKVVLGNHDLHLLATAVGARAPGRRDTLDTVLDHPKREAWIEWLRAQPLVAEASGWVMVHAGLAPSWTRVKALALSREVEAALAGPGWRDFLRAMYGDRPARWDDSLHGHDRLRAIVNTTTRMRFCTADGTLDFDTKEGASAAPRGYWPWFDVPGRASAGTPVAFGHWSTLGLVRRPDLLALDTGCVWGGPLTAVRVDGGRQEVVQVACSGSLPPGADG